MGESRSVYVTLAFAGVALMVNIILVITNIIVIVGCLTHHHVALAFAGVALMVCLIPIFIVAFAIPTIINLFVIG